MPAGCSRSIVGRRTTSPRLVTTIRSPWQFAGFAQDELTLAQEPNLLIVTGQKSGEDKGEYLHRGIAGRDFQRRFELADHVKVVGASLVNGLLTVELKREIPEAMKPRRIEIGTDAGAQAPEQRQLETDKNAA